MKAMCAIPIAVCTRSEDIMTIVVGLDFDGLIGDYKSYLQGGAQYTEWRDAIGATTQTAGTKPRWEDKVMWDALHEAHTNPESPLFLREIPGAIETIKALLAEGFILPVVTARSKPQAALATHWLALHGLELNMNATHSKTKRDALLYHGAKAHVDDTPEMLVDLYPDIPNRFLFSHGPYTKEVPDGLHLVTSWEADIGPVLRKLARAYA